ncbi:MAG: glycosyltransferase family 4 protein [Thermoleophilaceae bacterium]
MTRIAVVLQGNPADASAWSGVPAGVISGLRAAGAEAVPIAALFPGSRRVARALRMSWVDQCTNPVFSRACGIAADRAIAAAGPLDGAVAIGSGYLLSTEVPTVTYEDMTVSQALALPDPTYESLGDRAARRWRARQRHAYERSRGCCVSSEWAARSVRDDYGIEAAKVHVVGFGRNSEPRAVARDWSTPRFLFVGGDWERKRGDAVVEAFAAVRERHPDATLDLVGGHPPIDRPGVTGHGFVAMGTDEGRERYASLLMAATCLVLPSRYEPFGISYLDAGAWGVPSIGTTVGAAASAIGDGGRVVSPENADELARAMLEIADPDVARRLGARAYERTDLFTWQAAAERILRALRPPGVDVSTLAPFLDSAILERTA